MWVCKKCGNEVVATVDGYVRFKNKERTTYEKHCIAIKNIFCTKCERMVEIAKGIGALAKWVEGKEDE